jgi:adenosylcobinamide kinase/adenosylcobinamide-phosphate guanylyltransferase
VSLVLVTGGIRSGKSRFAEDFALSKGDPPWVYLPTAWPSDAEMVQRIERHRQQRDARFSVLPLPESPLPGGFLDILRSIPDDATLLLDGFGLLLGQLFEGKNVPDLPALVEKAHPLVDALTKRTGLTVVVTDEAGSGGIPLTPSGRIFADMLGEVNQKLALGARFVYLIVAGYPLPIKT